MLLQLYCGLKDSKMRASDTDLSVTIWNYPSVDSEKKIFKSATVRCLTTTHQMFSPNFSQFDHLINKRRHFFLSLPTEKETLINWLKKFGDSEFEIGKTIWWIGYLSRKVCPGYTGLTLKIPISVTKTTIPKFVLKLWPSWLIFGEISAILNSTAKTSR